MKNYLRHLWLIFAFIGLSCAYFNTFYNAQLYYEKAENQRLEKLGQKLPNSILDDYGKSIKRCQKVIVDYPESRYKVPAMMLMSKARFYRNEFQSSLETLNQIKQGDHLEFEEEVIYWIALNKWKLGKVQFALDELKRLSQKTPSKELKSRCLLSLAEINLELNHDQLALEELELAADFARNNTQKSQIYSRLADLAFKNGDYTKALKAYKSVVKTSLTREKIENAHLQLLKIYRLQADYKTATRKIKSMLTDDKFNKIAGKLNIELVQLYIAQKEYEQAETRLQSIVNDYQRSVESAEAYYLLGQLAIDVYWDLDKSKEYFEKVGKEYNKTPYKFLAGEKQKDIQLYQNTVSNIALWKQNQAETDSTVISKDSTETELTLPDNFDIVESYYLLADLDAFRFNRLDSSITKMEKIRREYPNSEFVPKTIFTSVFIYSQLGDSIQSRHMKKQLSEHYPNSEYSQYFSDVPPSRPITHVETKLKQAESSISTDISQALMIYRHITETDSSEENSVIAGYYLGYYYDWIHVNPDSALKYYSWVLEHHPESGQGQEASNRINIMQSILSDTLSSSVVEIMDSTLVEPSFNQ